MGFTYYGIGRGLKPIVPIIEEDSARAPAEIDPALAELPGVAQPPQIPPGGNLGEERT